MADPNPYSDEAALIAGGRCPLCRAPLVLLNDHHEGYRQGQIFRIFECVFCDTQMADPMVVDDRLYEAIYQNAERVPGYARYFRSAEAVQSAENPLDFLAESECMYWFVREFLSGYDPEKRLSILEIGSGLGYLTHSLNRAGWTAKGIDLSEKAVERATATFGSHYAVADLLEYSVEHAGTCDIIVMTEVFEHVPNVFSFLDAIQVLLKPGGIALISTQDKNFDDPGTYWLTDNPPVHLWWFSERSMTYLAARTALNVLFFDFSGYNRDHNPLDGFHVHIGDQSPQRRKPSFFNEQYELIANAKTASPGVLGRLKGTLRKGIPEAGYDRIRGLYRGLFDNRRQLQKFYQHCLKTSIRHQESMGAVFCKQPDETMVERLNRVAVRRPVG